MFIIREINQSCYGPFNSKDEAIAWVETTFNDKWENLCPHHFVCHHVEKPFNPTNEDMEVEHVNIKSASRCFRVGQPAYIVGQPPSNVRLQGLKVLILKVYPPNDHRSEYWYEVQEIRSDGTMGGFGNVPGSYLR